MAGRKRTAGLDDPLAQHLRKWRDDRGLSTQDVYEITGISVRTLETIERGKSFLWPKLLMLALREDDD